MFSITALVGLGVVYPLTVMPWRTIQSSAAVVHEVPGALFPLVSVAPARSRSGTLRCLFKTEADAEACRDLLSTADLFQIECPSRPSLEFVFAVTGELQVEIDVRSNHWYVSVDYREVA